MAEDSDLERTEPASSSRLEKARQEGRVPQSRELTAFLVLLAGASGFWSMGNWLTQSASGIVRQGLSFGRDAVFDSHALGITLHTQAWQALLLAAPLFLLAALGAVASPTLIGGLVFTPNAMSMDLGRINPLKGLGRIFSMQGVAELIKALLKAALVGGVVYWVVIRQQDELFALLSQPLESGLVSFGHMLQFAILALVGGIALIAAIDVPFQLWQYYSKLRMTKEEVRQEGKEQEGDPQVKARIRSQQRELARKRMMSEVPKADVVVTNPSHYAVALKYDSSNMGAPQVVAKGMNLIAQKIREVAAENGVPLLEAPPLARALYRHSDIGDQIPAALYTAVAEVMAYVYQLNQFLAGGGKGLLPPQQPTALPVPSDMDPGALEALAA
ncbi:MAG: flagellar type III secretion system protein FlhB [Betaproteobacteria bacterium]|nr:flagellar type III secretion system protein FlhB [Betaproteobacteria bacterium]